MIFDAWTFTVLGLVAVVLLRPAAATVAQRYGPRATERKYNPERAGGGAAMLFMAGYLISTASHRVGEGYWDMAADALHDSFLLSLPVVWVPALCWGVLIVLGLWWLYRGIRGYRGPRRPMTLVWALNEIAVCGALLILGVYLPEDWSESTLINFGLEGIYLGFLIGAVLRFILVLLNPGGPSHPIDPKLEAPGSTWLGRFRRF